jgi:hypothetical protein
MNMLGALPAAEVLSGWRATHPEIVTFLSFADADRLGAGVVGAWVLGLSALGGAGALGACVLGY